MNERARYARDTAYVETGDRTVLIKIPTRERNVDVCHPGTGVLLLLLLLALTISLASRSVARGDGLTSITNANRLRRRQRQAWYLRVSTYVSARVRAFTRRRKTFQSFSVTTGVETPRPPSLTRLRV